MPDKHMISNLTLEQFTLGELPPDTERLVREELERDEGLRARLAALEESDREILRDYPPERVVPAIRERLRMSEGAVRRRAVTLRLAVALPAAAVVVLFAAFFVARERLLPDETRLKGVVPHVTVYRNTPDGAEEMPAGAPARRGDVLQLSYTAADARYGAIFSVDGRGTVTWHLPGGYAGGPREAPALEMQGQVILPAAYELDDAPGFERFVLVFSARPFDLAEVERAARALASRPQAAERGAPPLPAGVSQFSLVLKKKG